MIESDDYRAYMLRLWRDDGASPWRAQLEDASSSRRYNFTDVGQLVDFLLSEMAQNGNDEDRSPWP